MKSRKSRFVSSAGPDRVPPRAPRQPFVCFLASAATLAGAKRHASALEKAQMSIVIYERTYVGRRFRLQRVVYRTSVSRRWQVEPGAKPSSAAATPRFSYDLFRVPDKLLHLAKRVDVARIVASVVDKYGQQPPPGDVDP
jgi:hypothetical protein